MATEFTDLKRLEYPCEIGYQLNDGVRTVQRFDAGSKAGGRKFEDALIALMKSFRQEDKTDK